MLMGLLKGVVHERIWSFKKLFWNCYKMLFYDYYLHLWIDFILKNKEFSTKSITFSGLKNMHFVYKFTRNPMTDVFWQDHVTCDNYAGILSISGKVSKLCYLLNFFLFVKVNFAKIKASETLFACWCFYFTLSWKWYQNRSICACNCIQIRIK